MLKLHLLLLALMIVAGGCSTDRGSEADDWMAKPTELPVEVEHVSEAPKIAPVRDIDQTVGPVRTNLNLGASWVSLARWAQENNVGTVTQISAAPARRYSLMTSNGVFVFSINSLIARWQGTTLHLGFEPQIIKDQPFLHVLDLKKNVEPLLRKLSVTAKTNRVIVIDPGHGGSNPGTHSDDGKLEKDYTLDWARRLVPLLASNGWQVFVTRTNDIDLSLSNRVAFADEHAADLFISLHFNAPSRQEGGLETFCLTPVGMRSTLTREFTDDPTAVFPNNAFDAENLQYAMMLHRALLKETGVADRGIRRARFQSVIRGQNCPAVLIEGGYLSNPQDAKQIDDPAFRQKLAEAVAHALTPPAQKVAEPPTEPPSTNSPAIP